MFGFSIGSTSLGVLLSSFKLFIRLSSKGSVLGQDNTKPTTRLFVRLYANAIRM
jgi:hypothetical protein